MEKSCSTCQHWFNPAHKEPCNSCGNQYLNFTQLGQTKPMPDGPEMVALEPVKQSALHRQVAGGHYKDKKIQPIEYIHANAIPFSEGCVIKYVSRWRERGGIKDLEKAKHFIEMLIELEGKS